MTMFAEEPNVTYEAVARWLPADVREAIEVSIPCSRGMVDTGHLWAQEYAIYPEGVRKWWQCFNCGITAREDPRPIASFARLMEKGL
jgi:hypothetical protein